MPALRKGGGYRNPRLPPTARAAQSLKEKRSPAESAPRRFSLKSLPTPMSTLTSIDELIFGATVPQSVLKEEPPTDHALLEATRAGDEAAFAELVKIGRAHV